jgi:hypothetical protein
MRKILVVLFLGAACVGTANAASSVRGGKANTTINYSTTVTLISKIPSTVYGVVLSSATTAGDYVVLWDSASATGLTTPVTTGLKAKVILSTGTSQVVSFDPPLIFNNGIVAANSAATTLLDVVFEGGKVIQGY